MRQGGLYQDKSDIETWWTGQTVMFRSPTQKGSYYTQGPGLQLLHLLTWSKGAGNNSMVSQKAQTVIKVKPKKIL